MLSCGRYWAEVHQARLPGAVPAPFGRAFEAGLVEALSGG